jgi:hypothetical protein
MVRPTMKNERPLPRLAIAASASEGALDKISQIQSLDICQNNERFRQSLERAMRSGVGFRSCLSRQLQVAFGHSMAKALFVL